MSVVKGKNMTIVLNGQVIACGRSCALNTTTSFIETTTVGSGKWATFKPQKNSATGSAEGVVFLNESGKLTLPDVRWLQVSHALLTGYFERISDDNTSYTDTIDFYITNISDTGAAGDFNTFSLEMQITGALYLMVIKSITATSFIIYQPHDAGVTWDVSINNGSSYLYTGITGDTQTVTGLTTNTTYQLVRRMNLPGGITKILPAIPVHTL